MIRIAKVWAAAHGRHFVLPDDVKTLARPVWQHRLLLDAEAEFAGTSSHAGHRPRARRGSRLRRRERRPDGGGGTLDAAAPTNATPDGVTSRPSSARAC